MGPIFLRKGIIFCNATSKKDMEKVGAASEEGNRIKPIVEKDNEISKDDAKTIQDEKDLLMEVPTAASERVLEVIIDLEEEYGLSETMGEAPSKPSLIFPVHVEEIDEKHLDCFNEGHPPNSCKRWLVDEIMNFYIFWK